MHDPLLYTHRADLNTSASHGVTSAYHNFHCILFYFGSLGCIDGFTASGSLSVLSI